MRPLRILRADVESHEVVDDAMASLQQQRIDNKIPDTLILVQHPEVVTLGPVSYTHLTLPTNREV